MKLNIINNIVRIKFQSHSILLEIDNFKLYLNGNLINLKRNVRVYNKDLQKDITTKYVQSKKTLFQFKLNNQVLIVDYINEHKIYFRLWNSIALFNKWREPASELILINYDFRNKIVYLYQNDLNNYSHFWDLNKPDEQQTLEL